MPTITIDKMIFNNFMGLEYFEFEPNGKDASITGRNGAGKTSIFTGWTFLLFDKDPQGRSDFNIKTIKNNEVQHNLEHSIEALIRIDNKPMSLKKIYRETYTRKRGTTVDTFTGHETLNYIDGLKVQKKEWEKRLFAVFDFEQMRILSMIGYFTSDDFGKGLKPAKPAWKWRRDILFSLDENMPTDDDIMDDELKGILNGKTYEDYQAMLKQQQSNINSDIKGIGPRIDEKDRDIKAVKDLDRSTIEKEIKSLEKQIQDIKDKSSTTTLRKKKGELEADLQQARNQLQKAQDDREKGINAELNTVNGDMETLKDELHRYETRMKDKEIDIKRYKSKRERLIEDWNREFKKEHTDISTNLCPECGYNLNEKQNNINKSEFETQKDKKLKSIEDEGFETKNNIEKAEQDFDELDKKRNEDLKKYREFGEKQIALREKKESITGTFNREMKQAADKVDDIESKIKSIEIEMRNVPASNTSELETALSDERKKIAKLDAVMDAEKRIQELKDDEKRLAKEYEKLEYENSLIEAFVVKKVSLIENSINDKFELVRFKLFDVQINEGIKEMCTATIDGVEFSKGLNTGAEINGNMDIIRALSRHWKLWTPLFVDHSESINVLTTMDSQVIKLQVSGDQELRIKQ